MEAVRNFEASEARMYYNTSLIRVYGVTIPSLLVWFIRLVVSTWILSRCLIEYAGVAQTNAPFLRFFSTSPSLHITVPLLTHSLLGNPHFQQLPHVNSRPR